jgi:hypothetical protein
MRKNIFSRTVLAALPGVSLNGVAEDIRDVRPPLDIPPNYVFLYLFLTLAVLLLLSFLVYTIWKGMSRSQVKPVATKTAWELAYERLDDLAKENLPPAGRIDEFYTKLSLIVRWYMEERFGIRAPEMTTEEFLILLNNSSELGWQHKNSLRNFLGQSDLVKFAKGKATPTDMEASFILARSLVDETRPAPLPEANAAMGGK